MVDEVDLEDCILGSPFYTYRRGDGLVWLGVMTPFGVLALSFLEADWVDWLRKEMGKSHPAEIPAVWSDS